MTPFRKGRDNCLSWAIEKWEKEGGYLAIRWCRQNKTSWLVWPHFLWIPEDEHDNMRQAIPNNDKDNEDRLIPKIWFYPRIVKGDYKDL